MAQNPWDKPTVQATPPKEPWDRPGAAIGPQSGPGTYMPPPPPPPSVRGFLENAAMSLPKALASPLQLLNPQTYVNLAKIAGGGVESFFPENNPHFSREEVPAWNAAKEYVGNRFGHPLKTLYEDPAGALIDLSALLSGSSALLRGGGKLAAEAAPDIASALSRTGKIAGRTGELMNPLRAAAKATGFVNRAAGKTGLAAVGLMTGRGEAAADLWDIGNIQASIPGFKPMSRAKAAMKGLITEEDTYKNMNDLLTSAKDKRMAEYTPRMAALPPTDLTSSLDRVRTNFDDKLWQFRIGRVPPKPIQPISIDVGEPGWEGLGSRIRQYNADLASWKAAYPGRNPGELNFRGSGIEPTSEAGAKILETDKLLSEWAGYSPWHTQPLGMDLLKRSVDDMWSDSSKARSVIQSVKSNIRSELENNIPEYAKITEDYHKTSQFMEWLEAEFSLDNKNPSVGIRKLQNALVNNTGQRRQLITRLNGIIPGAGDNLMAEIAGHSFSGFAPKGIMGPMSGMGLVYNFLRGRLSPETLMAVPLVSPRAMGTGILGLKGIMPAISGTGRVAANVASNPLLNLATRSANAPMSNEDLSKVTATIGSPHPSDTRRSLWTPDSGLQPVKR